MTRNAWPSARSLTAVAALVTVALVGGCGMPEAVAPQRQKPAVPFPQPSGVQFPAEIPTEQPSTCQPRQSLRPLGPLPPPGDMPAGSTMAEIRRRGRLIVGIGNNPLLSSRDSRSGHIQGFEADIVREVAFAIFGDRDPKRIQFRSLNLADRLPAIQGVTDDGEKVDTVDMALLTTIMNCDRWQEVAFSAEYYTSHQRMLAYRNSPITGIADLAGKKVCASTTSPNLLVITSAEPRLVPVSAPNTNDCLILLQQGQVDAVSTGDVILAGLAAQDPDTHIVGPKLTDDPVGIMMAHQSTDLIRFVNGVLEKLMSDGTWVRFQENWLATQIGPAEPPIPQYRPE